MNTSYKTITSAANPVVKKIRGPKSRKNRAEENLFCVEGAEYTRAALDAQWHPDAVAFAAEHGDEKEIRDICRLAREKGVTAMAVTHELMQRMSGKDNAPQVLGVFRQQWHTLGAAGDRIVALDNIRDPGNLGTIARTAAATGVRDIVLIDAACDAFSPEAVRASAGAFCHARFIRASAREFMDWKRGWKGRVVGTHLDAETDYRAGRYAPPVLLLMGDERNGLSPELAAACDMLVKIPMPGGTESLNLAVSTGIMLYEILRQEG